MVCNRTAAVFSLAVFLFGGWLPQIVHGPGHVQFDAGTASKAAAACSCSHQHGPASETATTDEVAGFPAPSHQDDCPICELIGILTLPTAVVIAPTPVSEWVDTPATSPARVARFVRLRPPLRGPPATV